MAWHTTLFTVCCSEVLKSLHQVGTITAHLLSILLSVRGRLSQQGMVTFFIKIKEVLYNLVSRKIDVHAILVLYKLNHCMLRGTTSKAY